LIQKDQKIKDLPPAGYFFLDKKVAKKSRPSRNLPEQIQKFLPMLLAANF
jgi:hypothetical protein